jgi:hypothetical protein
MVEWLVPTLVAGGFTAIGAAYALGRDQGKKFIVKQNGNGKSQYGQFMTKEMCNLAMELSAEKLGRKMDALMAHFGLTNDEKENPRK